MALESHWWSLTAGVETAGMADADTSFFHAAQGWTRSAYLSGGMGLRWMGAAGISDQRLSQDRWSWRGIRRMVWLKDSLDTRWGIEVLGHTSTAFESARVPTLGGVLTLQDRDHGWSAGGGLSYCPWPWRTTLWKVEGRALRLRGNDLLDQATRLWTGELALSRQSWSGRQHLGLLVNRRGRRTQLAGLARAEQVMGAWSGNASLMLGHQEAWYDVEKLVVHDGLRELKVSAGAGLEWRAWKGLSLEGSAGWEKSQGVENRWIFGALKWTHQVWEVSR
jgi:hypothetical protein